MTPVTAGGISNDYFSDFIYDLRHETRFHPDECGLSHSDNCF